MDANLRVIGEGRAGPSNPLRVGIAGAAAAVREAIDRACVMAKVRRGDLVAARDWFGWRASQRIARTHA